MAASRQNDGATSTSCKRVEVRFDSQAETLTASLYGESSRGVILCPPHPSYGGSRHDTRIVRIARALASHYISALCMDYGRYGRGVSEVQHVIDAITFMASKVHALGLLGYSFGAVVAANVAAQRAVDGFVALSLLKRVNGLRATLDFTCPKLFVHGTRDTVAPYTDFIGLYNSAKDPKEQLLLDTDHFYMDRFPHVLVSASQRIVTFFHAVLPL